MPWLIGNKIKSCHILLSYNDGTKVRSNAVLYNTDLSVF